MIIITI